MDAKLLQKIEELTLYTIQQEKEIKAQKEVIMIQQKDIEKLKKLSYRLSRLENILKLISNKE
ncbi:hypothetical protein [Aquimarina sp. RZ0]|uniref:hypothetical protein n=1 Tax=Aquimarina sp. RZ0 TaxID=2607730 RepID=UPI0011F15021|nr:hypothetical protein [Aquimarina sp. RZ0]KAA1244073.1 hypothetical protein F0000_18285 [Aquimarina sp. RZ0]